MAGEHIDRLDHQVLVHTLQGTPVFDESAPSALKVSLDESGGG
jgi:hypothetical protein